MKNPLKGDNCYEEARPCYIYRSFILLLHSYYKMCVGVDLLTIPACDWIFMVSLYPSEAIDDILFIFIVLLPHPCNVMKAISVG